MDVKLASVDDLFTTEESRAEDRRKVQMLCEPYLKKRKEEELE